jgi:hypothetical protein
MIFVSEKKKGEWSSCTGRSALCVIVVDQVVFDISADLCLFVLILFLYVSFVVSSVE